MLVLLWIVITYSVPPLITYKQCIDWTCVEHTPMVLVPKPFYKKEPVSESIQLASPKPVKEPPKNTVEDLTLDEDLLREVSSIEQSLVLEEELLTSNKQAPANSYYSPVPQAAPSAFQTPQVPNSYNSIQGQQGLNPFSLPRPQFSQFPNVVNESPLFKSASGISQNPSLLSLPPSSLSPTLQENHPPFSDMDTSGVEEATVNSTSIQFATANSVLPIDSTAKVEHKSFSVMFGDGTEIKDISGVLKNCPVSDKELLDKNKEVFGHNAFRSGQIEVMKAVLTGHSVFCIMPTGGGKSLCYQLPALLLPGITIVVSPLISLVQDQIRGLQEAGVEVGAMTGNSGDEVPSALWNSVRTRQFPRLKLVYTTPEKLNKSEGMKNLLRALNSLGFLSLFVIDEVHCMSQWGHDFRVDYKELGKVRFEFFQNVPLMAFTATATATVKNDILKLLLVKGNEILVFQKSFNRPELHYEVRSKKSHRQFISDVSQYILSKQLNNSGIIYCGTQMACEKVCKDLQESMKNEGYENKIGFYHAGLEPLERERIQREWSEDRLKIIVATVAFGMGINKTDVRFVIHYMLPHSLTHYYQGSLLDSSVRSYRSWKSRKRPKPRGLHSLFQLP